MADYWFGPKRIGYGIRPQNWKGWFVLLAFAVLLTLAALLLVPQGRVTEFIVAMIVLFVVFGVVVYFQFDRQAGKQ